MLVLGPFPEPYRSYWKDRWFVILERWGLKPPSDETVQAVWNQPPLPGQQEALLTISNRDIIESKERWKSESGYDDMVRCVLAAERHYFPRPNASNGDASSKQPSSQSAGSPLSHRAVCYPMKPGRRLKPRETHKQWTGEDGITVEAVRLPDHEITQLSELIYSMLRYDPSERIDTAAVLRHEWFGGRAVSEEGRSAQSLGAKDSASERKRRSVQARSKPPEQPTKKLRRSSRIAARMRESNCESKNEKKL